MLGDRLRAARDAYGISLRELARRIGVSASLISQIETVDELLFEDAPITSRPAGDRWAFLTDHPHMEPVQRGADRQLIELDSGVRWERLTTESVPGIDFLYLVYEPGGESSPKDGMQRHTGREWGYVIEGTLNVTIGFDEHVLEAGDSVAFDSTVPHRFHNEGDTEVRAIWYVLGWQSGRPTPVS